MNAQLHGQSHGQPFGTSHGYFSTTADAKTRHYTTPDHTTPDHTTPKHLYRSPLHASRYLGNARVEAPTIAHPETPTDAMPDVVEWRPL